jgi:hypothetical protein
VTLRANWRAVAGRLWEAGSATIPGREVLVARCADCPWRKHAERRPTSWWARLWRWHTRWCPGWRAYQAELARERDEGRL